jgi:ribosomal protein S18 acetylase RimI-like enzyme
MTSALIDIRHATADDAPALAAVREEAWRATYQGLIPHITLQQMIASHTPGWWQKLLNLGASVLLLDFDGETQGYATYGRSRHGPTGCEGEIYELYLMPVYQGAGLGRQLFEASRRELARRNLQDLVVRSLRDNEHACAFYEALGGQPSKTAIERLGGQRLERIAYVWP